MNPNTPADDLAAMQHLIADFTAAERQVEQANRRLNDAHAAILHKIAELRAKLDSPYAPEVVAVARHLYWQQPGFRTKPLAKAAGFSHHQEMLRALGGCPSGLTCAGCGRDIPRTSRSWTPPYNRLCPDCDKDRSRKEQRRYQVEALRARIIGDTKVPAAARDWLAVTALVVAYPPLSMGIPQDHEDARQLGTWVGWENARNLQQELLRAGAAGDTELGVALAPADALLKTALHVVGWDTARTVEVVCAYTEAPAHMLITRLRAAAKEVRERATARAYELYPEGYEPTPEEQRVLWARE